MLSGPDVETPVSNVLLVNFLNLSRLLHPETKHYASKIYIFPSAQYSRIKY
jgi:hypothetical protein